MDQKRRLIVFTLALAAAFGLIGMRGGVGPVAADGVATVSCVGGSTGLNDCTITLTTAIAPGGTFTGTLSNSAAIFLACNTIPVGGPCSSTSSTVTFNCPSGCSSGMTFRDVVQLSSGSGSSQSFTANGATASVTFPNPATAVFPLPASASSGSCITPFGAVVACGSGVIGAGSSCFTQGLVVPCSTLSSLGANCLVATSFGSFNLCNTNAFANTSPSCITQSLVGLVNVCNGFNNTGCNAISPTGIVVNLCGFQPFTTPAAAQFSQFTNFGFGLNGACIQTLQTLSGPVTVQVC